MSASSLSSCSSAKNTSNELPPATIVQSTQGYRNGHTKALPKAVIYKTNGNYDQNVTITLSDNGQKIVSYPAPTDVSEASEPQQLDNGWLLDRRGGINTNTAFLKYTYKEYSELKEVPSPAQLMEAILPGAKVMRIEVLPYTYNQVQQDPTLLKPYTE